MKWLHDNTLGMLLVVTSGGLTLLALLMAIVWGLPEAGESAAVSTVEPGSTQSTVLAHQVAALSEFQVINERPIFNQSRQPEVNDIEADESVDNPVIAVKDAPDVRLTGVIITPRMKIASLTPADKALKGIMAREGEILEGEFVGWQINSVSPRNVVLQSRDGQSLDLELQVHDLAIKQPPKPVVPVKTARAEPVQGEQVIDEDGQPLSRAEQIRIRIAERREQLRREQEAQQARMNRGEAPAGRDKEAAKQQNYQNALRTMMRNKGKSQNDKKDG